MNRIKDKIQEIDKFLEELETLIPNNFEEYKRSLEKKAACERYFEKIVEAVVDLVFLIIKNKKLEKPRDDENAFYILYKNNIIQKDLYKRLKDAKGMKNIIAHQYGKIDDKQVFNSLEGELINDVNQFIEDVSKWEK